MGDANIVADQQIDGGAQRDGLADIAQLRVDREYNLVLVTECL